jgi:hypothetical protein
MQTLPSLVAEFPKPVFGIDPDAFEFFEFIQIN